MTLVYSGRGAARLTGPSMIAQSKSISVVSDSVLAITVRAVATNGPCDVEAGFACYDALDARLADRVAVEDAVRFVTIWEELTGEIAAIWPAGTVAVRPFLRVVTVDGVIELDALLIEDRTTKVIATRLTTLSAELGGLTSTVETQATALVDLEGISAATYRITTASGPSQAELVLVAPNGAPSLVRIAADNIVLNGSVKAHHLDAATLSVAGLSVFGGDLRSANFVSGVSGFRLTQSGVFEGAGIINRGALTPGAVSDVQRIYRNGEYVWGETNWTLRETLGISNLAPDAMWTTHLMGRARGTAVGDEGASLRGTSIGLYRSMLFQGVWTPFGLVYYFNTQGTGDWEWFNFSEDVSGEFSAVVYELRSIWNVTVQPPAGPNAANIALSARSVKR